MSNSPLPDASALEAGILEDQRPSRLSRVQDNVRNLLRTSVFGSVASSPTTPVRPATARTQPGSFSPITPRRPGEVLHSTQSSTASSPTHYTSSPVNLPIPALPTHRNVGQQSASSNHYQSTLYNTRAVTALNHPDLSDPSMESLSQQKSHQQRQRSRSGTSRSHKRSHRGRRAAKKAACSSILLCVLAALLLASLVATYISIATTATGITTTFHVLFILGILLSLVVFSHTALRLCIASRKRSAAMPAFISASSRDRSGSSFHAHAFRRPHRHHHSRRNLNSDHRPRSVIDHYNEFVQNRQLYASGPTPTTQTTPIRGPTVISTRPFIPLAPIQVHTLSSESSLCHNDIFPPSRLPQINTQSAANKGTIPPPPPAYGRWRGSVRADPELLHWAPSPTTAAAGGEALPSPTYEEAVGGVGGPPSYRTRESPPRGGVSAGERAEMREVGREGS